MYPPDVLAISDIKEIEFRIVIISNVILSNFVSDRLIK
jgi:hypothetical protein